MCDKAKFDSMDDQINLLSSEVGEIKGRLSKVEVEVGRMRVDTQEGFRACAIMNQKIDTALDNLAHDFGDRMNTLDKRIVAEKEKWGETFRWTVKVVIRVLCGLALAAGGITVCRMFFAT